MAVLVLRTSMAALPHYEARVLTLSLAAAKKSSFFKLKKEREKREKKEVYHAIAPAIAAILSMAAIVHCSIPTPHSGCESPGGGCTVLLLRM
jgi:hypothetical protein